MTGQSQDKPTVDPIADQQRVAGEVRALYEEHPYPAHGVLSSVVALLIEDTVAQLQAFKGTRELRYLDAGCGTGEQTLGVAKHYPDLRVVGIDRNRASLELARAMQERNHLPAAFLERDLTLPLAPIDPPDLIVSMGVLHTLPDPVSGFRRLREIAQPHTMLVGMVYGTFGKWPLHQVRDALGLICGEDMPRATRLAILRDNRLTVNTGPLHYLHLLRERLKFGPRIPWMEAAQRVLKGRNAAYQADAYTHVQEVVYTWRELSQLLADSGWRWKGWPRHSGMPDRADQLFRGEACRIVESLPLLERAEVYERLVQPPHLYFVAEAM